MFKIKVAEKIKQHISSSVTFFRKSWRLLDNVEKHGGARETTDNKKHARCMPVSKATRAQAHARACARTPTRARIRMHLPTYARAYTHRHTHT